MNEYEMEWHIIKKSDGKKSDKKFQFKTYQAYNFPPPPPLKTFTIGILGDNIKNN